MYLYLVQHAHARPKEQDPDRSLSEEGRDAITRVATYASKKVTFHLTEIQHSGKLRAEQTAEVLATDILPTGGISVADGLSPLDDPAIWAERLKEYQEDTMLVGHLPHLQRLAALLLCGDSDKPVVAFSNAGIVCLERTDDGSWSLAWVITPDIV
jgi:phosphohistidine phosphatase